MQARTVLRQGPWTYIPPHEGPAVSPTTRTELGNADEPQLYNLDDDIRQIANRARAQREIAESMDARLQEILGSTRTRS